MKAEQGRLYLLKTELEMNFGGREEVEELVRRDIKLVSLRKDSEKYREAKPGQIVTANFGDRKKDLVVWGASHQRPLDEISPVLLALNGYMDVSKAVRDLRSYPGYEEINRISKVSIVGTVTKDRFASLSREQQMLLLGGKGQDREGEIAKNSELKELMRPAVARWIFKQGEGVKVQDWLDFYLMSGMMSRGEFDKVVNYGEKVSCQTDLDVLGDPDDAKFLMENPTPDEGFYKNCYLPLVVGDLSQADQNW
jgi:hypothetical protein